VAYGSTFNELLWREPYAKSFFHSNKYFYYRERMSSKLQKIVVETDVGGAENFLPHRRQSFRNGSCGSDTLGRRWRYGRQSRIVDLAARCLRQTLHRKVSLRHSCRIKSIERVPVHR